MLNYVIMFLGDIMENLAKLNSILLGYDVLNNFHAEYDKNKEFKIWINSIIPEVEKCSKQNQKTPWHKYNVLDHILKSVEEMNKQTQALDINVRRLLAYTMFYHDVGKPACHGVKIVDNEQRDTFYKHNLESEKIVYKTAKFFGFNQKEIALMATLVNKHDLFMFLTLEPTTNPYKRELTNKVIETEVNNLSKVGDGKTLMQYLIYVGIADNLAQNEKMTKDSLFLLEKFDNMFKNEFCEDTSEITK